MHVILQELAPGVQHGREGGERLAVEGLGGEQARGQRADGVDQQQHPAAGVVLRLGAAEDRGEALLRLSLHGLQQDETAATAGRVDRRVDTGQPQQPFLPGLLVFGALRLRWLALERHVQRYLRAPALEEPAKSSSSVTEISTDYVYRRQEVAWTAAAGKDVMFVNHDQLWRELIQQVPKELLTLVAPDLAARIDASQISLQAEKHYLDSPEGRPRRLDLVSRVREKGSPTDDAVLHIEVQLEFRARLPPRWWRYNRVLFLRHGLPVHTIVVYLRGGPPGVARSVYRETSLGREVASFRYLSLGLSRASAEELLARPEPLAWAFAALTRSGSHQRRTRLRLACLRRIAGAPDLDEQRRFQLFNCVATYIDLGGSAKAEYEALLAEHGNSEVQAMMMTWAEQIEARAEERGKAAGYARGIREGREEGSLQVLRDLVFRLLKRRFDRVPAALARQIADLDSRSQLMRLAEQAPEIDSLGELRFD